VLAQVVELIIVDWSVTASVIADAVDVQPPLTAEVEREFAADPVSLSGVAVRLQLCSLLC